MHIFHTHTTTTKVDYFFFYKIFIKFIKIHPIKKDFFSSTILFLQRKEKEGNKEKSKTEVSNIVETA